MAKILVIDDARSIRSLLASLLRRKGYQVMLAENGAEGLELFRQEQPDAIVLDLKMPGMDGLTVLQHVRRVSLDQPVIMLTGTWTPTMEQQVRALGVTELLKKEFPQDQLEEALKRVLKVPATVV